MDREKNWLRFITSGKVEDYLNYVNSCRGSEIIGTGDNPIYDRGISYKGNERGGERPISHTFQ